MNKRLKYEEQHHTAVAGCAVTHRPLDMAVMLQLIPVRQHSTLGIASTSPGALCPGLGPARGAVHAATAP